ncbi:sortase [Cellulomonas soli]|uniref:Sortase n=1 Tax=Cellulomonas soli TaxID=931535 RepID=A0A512PF16_9CELL|nr:sortase [Cellulomonas soli]NYI59420.1 sortase A [Cellulomonas soli]GEP69788.1 sortase [Cellulomonas soli]
MSLVELDPPAGAQAPSDAEPGYAPPEHPVPPQRPVPSGTRSAPPRRALAPVQPRPPRPPRRPEPIGSLVVTTALLVLAALAGWALVQVLVLGSLAEARSQQVLYAQLREQLASQTAPTGGAVEPGAPVAILAIPTLGLQQVVVEGTSSGDLLAGPGHRRDTVLPGQAGVSLVLGRSTTYGGPFRSLPLLRQGDGITVTTGQGEFVYRVDGVRHDGDPLPGALTEGGARLTLVTTEGSGPFGAITGFTTVYVDATLVGEAVTGPSGRPAAVPASEAVLGGDTGALPVLVLALQALLLAAVAAVLLSRRLPARASWVLAAPVLVAAAWWATEVAVRLLPNVL